MPVCAKLLTGRNIGYMRFYGATLPPQYLRALDSLLSDPRTQPGTGILADLAALDAVEIGFSEMLSQISAEMRIARHVLPSTRYALFAPSDLGYGASRMFHQLAETVLPYHMEVFRSAADALSFLGQPERSISEFLGQAR